MSDNIAILMFFSAGIIGMFFNFAHKKASKTIDDTLLEYITNRPWRSVSSLGSLLAALAGSLAIGADFRTLPVIAGAFLAGFGIDKLVNKSK